MSQVPTNTPFHSLVQDEEMEDQEVPGAQSSSGEQLAPLHLLVKLEQLDGSPIPAFLFNVEAISEMIARETGVHPLRVELLTPTECAVQFPVGHTITTLALALATINQWFGYDVEINCVVASEEHLKVESKSKESSREC